MPAGKGRITLGPLRVEGRGPGLRVYADLPDGHPFYASIGLVASEWAHFEHALDLIIWDLAGIDPVRGACITSQIMGAGGRCKAISTLSDLRELPAAMSKSARTLMNDSYKVADKRARIVHDPWYIETERGQPGQFKSMAFTDPRHGIRDISQDEIDDALRAIRKLKVRAISLHHEFRDTLKALREKRA